MRFHKLALGEWNKLEKSIQAQFKKKFTERLKNPHIHSARLSGMSDCYKIKLLKAGYRLIYRVDEDIITVTVIAIGQHDKLTAYISAMKRI